MGQSFEAGENSQQIVTTSKSLMMFGPPHRFCRILISRLIFLFLTGLRILTTHLARKTRVSGAAAKSQSVGRCFSRAIHTTTVPLRVGKWIAAAAVQVVVRKRVAQGHLSPLLAFTPSNTSLYFPRPSLRISS